MDEDDIISKNLTDAFDKIKKMELNDKETAFTIPFLCFLILAKFKKIKRFSMEGNYIINLIETTFEWDKWMNLIPSIQFPSDWSIQIIPPFAGAISRFRANKGKESISVYLDCFDMLGSLDYELEKEPIPYWEAYPINEDIFRCEMNDTDRLIKVMKEEFERRK